jgi:hypothetical protein
MVNGVAHAPRPTPPIAITDAYAPTLRPACQRINQLAVYAPWSSGHDHRREIVSQQVRRHAR